MSETVYPEMKMRPLYALLVRGLPQYCKERPDGTIRLCIGDIAREIGMAKQGIYKRFEPGAEENTISLPMARKLMDLSAKQTEVPPGFKPLTITDFDPFLAA